MTLILTVITSGGIFQASDRRLTYSDGSIAESSVNKTVFAICRKGRFVGSYTGIAYMPDGASTLKWSRVDNWVVDQLSEMNARNLRIPEVTTELCSRLKRVYRLMPIVYRDLPLTLALAGFMEIDDGILPFVCNITNVDRLNHSIGDFHLEIHKVMPQKLEGFGLFLQIDGNEKAFIKPIRQRLNKKLYRTHALYELSSIRAASTIVSLIRMAAVTREAEGLIGLDCLSVFLDFKSGLSQNMTHKVGGAKEATRIEMFSPSTYGHGIRIDGDIAIEFSQPIKFL